MLTKISAKIVDTKVKTRKLVIIWLIISEISFEILPTGDIAASMSIPTIRCHSSSATLILIGRTTYNKPPITIELF